MKLYLVASIAQVDGGTRYVLVADRSVAQQWRREIDSDPAMIDAGGADYLVDDDDGRLTASTYPGATVSREEWDAIRAAI